jgi:hypothetical protein
VQIPVGRISGMSVSARVGKAPVDAAGRRGGPFAFTSPRALTKAKYAVLVVHQHLFVITGLTPPKAMAARLANPRAKMAEEMSGPKGTIRVFQPT